MGIEPPRIQASAPAHAVAVVLAKRLGVEVDGAEKWIAAAMTHPSAAGDDASGGVSGHQIEMLRSLGKFYADLLITHSKYAADPRLSAAALNDARGQWRPATVQAEKTLNLFTLGFFGKSFRRELEREREDGPLRARVAAMLHDQLLGAMVVCLNYATLKSYYARWYETVIRSTVARVSYKAVLQAIAQARAGATPTYETVAEHGVENSKTFTVRVRVGSDKSVVAAGPRKKTAQEHAAEAFLKRYYPNELQFALRSSPRPNSVALHDHRAVAPQHEGRLHDALRRYEIPESHAGRLSIALTHPSFKRFVEREGWPDNQALANLGSSVLRAGCHHRYFLRLFDVPQAENFRASVEIYVAKALEGRVLAPFADQLGLTSLTLQSRLASVNDSERAKRDTVAAMVAARFLSHWTRWSPFECIPRPIQEWIDAVPENAARTSDLKTPVSVLQELAQMFGLRVDYAPCSSVGPQHQAILLASLTLSPVQSHSERLTVEIRGGSGRSSNDARQSLAAKVIALLRAIHCDLKLARTLVDEVTMTATAKLVLGTAAECAPMHSTGALRWQIEGLLGTSYLRASDEQSFRAWLTDALRFIRTTHGPQFPNIVRHLTDFYSQYARSHSADLKTQCRTVLAEIEEPMAGSDPIARAVAIKESPAFRRLGALLRVLSVSSKPPNTVATLGHELESLSMLNRGQAGVNAASGADVSWIEREGSMLELFREMMTLSEFGLDRLLQDVRGSLHDGRVIVRFPAVIQHDALQIVSGLERSVVFQFLRADGFVHRVFCKDGLVVELSTGEDTHNFSPESICRAIANPLSTFPPQERAVANRLLHDLKNHLISASVASKALQTDRTSELRAQHEASAHLDAAKRLCEAFRAVSRSSDEVHLEDLSLREFFRAFCSRTLLELPAHVALRPPTNVDEVAFTTSSQLLTSIIDNLVRNAVEALDQPGLVSIEWTLTEDRALSIKMSDNGRGMPQDKLRKLICGETTNSDKAGGSGIGMFTVVSMLRRLGGTILGTSKIGLGTRWEVRLPNMQRMEYEPPTDATTDVTVRSITR